MGEARLVRPVRWLLQALSAFGQRHPVVAILVIIVLSNVFGTVFNILSNGHFIYTHCNERQQEVFFWLIMGYNPIAFPVGAVLLAALVWPIYRSNQRMLRGQAIPPEDLRHCRKALLQLPVNLMWVNSLCWLAGMFFFPAMICWLGGTDKAAEIWGQFLMSFGVGMALTVVQTLFLIEEFLIRVLYPMYFRDARPADVRGGLQSFVVRMFLFWGAVAVMPMVAIAALVSNVNDRAMHNAFVLTIAGGVLSGGCISLMVGWSLWRWIREHQQASARIARGDYTARVAEQRPDEWGKLTDRFNDMAAGLEQAEKVRETFGQMVHPEIRDEILQRFQGLGGEIREVTVMFADIRGFTQRTAGESPEKVVALLNRFLTLAVAAVEDKGGWVNKFLGDGVLALFGIRRSGRNHADQALDAALELLQRLYLLNQELRQQQQQPLQVGIGIHTGPVLFGCIGATVTLGDGRTTMRREITAIGETVNLGQRLEQLTKTLGGPILLSAGTARRLSTTLPLRSLGPQLIPGYQGTLEIVRFEMLDT
jgi:adenylate cyclase